LVIIFRNPLIGFPLGALNKCVTSDSVVILFCCLALIILSLLCSIMQLFITLNINLKFMKKFRHGGSLDVCCVFINCVCLGLMYWAASSISQFQFDEIKRNLPRLTFTNIEQTRSFIKNATKTMDAFSISFSGGFYFVLLAGLASLVSFATQTCSRSTIALRCAY
uniref:TMEM127 domain-containing protein n=1 Tax=Rodentolepis nana TaxID=102285 RepID=A0A0R3TV47_RODNA